MSSIQVQHTTAATIVKPELGIRQKCIDKVLEGENPFGDRQVEVERNWKKKSGCCKKKKSKNDCNKAVCELKGIVKAASDVGNNDFTGEKIAMLLEDTAPFLDDVRAIRKQYRKSMQKRLRRAIKKSKEDKDDETEVVEALKRDHNKARYAYMSIGMPCGRKLNKYKELGCENLPDPSESIASSFLELLSKKSPILYPEEPSHDETKARF